MSCQCYMLYVMSALSRASATCRMIPVCYVSIMSCQYFMLYDTCLSCHHCVVPVLHVIRYLFVMSALCLASATCCLIPVCHVSIISCQYYMLYDTCSLCQHYIVPVLHVLWYLFVMSALCRASATCCRIPVCHVNIVSCQCYMLYDTCLSCQHCVVSVLHVVEYLFVMSASCRAIPMCCRIPVCHVSIISCQCYMLYDTCLLC